MTPKKEETKSKKRLVAIVMEVTHGRFLTKHHHYTTHLLELDEKHTNEEVEEAAEKSSRMARKILGIRTRVLTVETVEITTREAMKDKVKKFMSDHK